MVEMYGKVPEYCGRGGPPSKKQPRSGWRYLQVVEQRDGKGNFLGTRLKAIYGDLEELLGKSIAFSKKIGMRKAAAVHVLQFDASA